MKKVKNELKGKSIAIVALVKLFLILSMLK